MASIALTIAAFNAVSAREWTLEGAMTGPQQARCSSIAAVMNRSTSGGVSCVGFLRLDTAIFDGLRIAALGHYSSISCKEERSEPGNIHHRISEYQPVHRAGHVEPGGERR